MIMSITTSKQEKLFTSQSQLLSMLTDSIQESFYSLRLIDNFISEITL